MAQTGLIVENERSAQCAHAKGASMTENEELRVVIVDRGRWIGLTARLPEALLTEGGPPQRLIAEVRETAASGRNTPEGQGLSRVRTVLCEFVEHLGADAFYAPLPDQHTSDDAWEDANRAIVRLRPLPSHRSSTRSYGGRA
jgi:hypothetical protein